MIPIKIKGAAFNIPQNWSEVTMKHYVEMVMCKDDLSTGKLLSIFTGIDYDTLQGFSMADFEKDIIPLMNLFEADVDFSKLTIPTELTINGKTIQVPQDLRAETFGQKILMHEKLNSAIADKSDMIKFFPVIAANYLQPNYHGEMFNDKKVLEVEKLINEMPVTDIYPIANFFLTSYIKSSQEN